MTLLRSATGPRPTWARRARSGRESEAPGWWRGLQGLWVPSLGATGNTLHDLSKHHRNGTLTNTPTWVTSPYGSALDFDAANERVVVPFAAPPIFDSTWMVVAKPYTGGSVGASLLFGTGPSAAVGMVFTVSDASPAQARLWVEKSAAAYIGRRTASIVTQNEWHVFAGTVQPGAAADSDVQVWVDGERLDSVNSSSNPGQPPGALWIGSPYNTYTSASTIAYVACWDRVLPDAAIKQLSADPGVMLRRRQWYTPAVGVPSIAAMQPDNKLSKPPPVVAIPY